MGMSDESYQNRSTTQTTPSEWVRARMRQIDHEIALKKIRDQGERDIRTLAEIRRLRESVMLTRQATKWLCIKHEARIRGTQISVDDARDFHRSVVEGAGIVPDSIAVDVARWQRHANEYIRVRGVRISWAALPTTNAYAWPKLNQIESQPIVSAESYATFQHEKGHNEQPCQPTHARARIDEKNTCCVRCEIDAWRFAQRDAIDWTESMHRVLAQSLGTYAPYATSTERDEILAISSQIGFLRNRLARTLAR